MNYLEICQFIIIDIDTEGEVETSISLVNDFEVSELKIMNVLPLRN